MRSCGGVHSSEKQKKKVGILKPSGNKGTTSTTTTTVSLSTLTVDGGGGRKKVKTPPQSPMKKPYRHNRVLSFSKDAAHRRTRSRAAFDVAKMKELELEADRQQRKNLRFASSDDTVRLPANQEDQLSKHHTPNFSSRRITDGSGKEKKKSGILREQSRAHSRVSSTTAFLDKLEKAQIQFLKGAGKGGYLMKVNKKNGLNKRWFEVSPDGSEIRWRKRRYFKLGAKNQTRYLADVEELVYMYDTEQETARAWCCFSIFFHDAPPLHIVCKDERQLDEWYLGLQALVGSDKSKYLSKGALLWKRFKMKIIYLCDLNGYTSDFECLKIFLQSIFEEDGDDGEKMADSLGTPGFPNEKEDAGEDSGTEHEDILTPQ